MITPQTIGNILYRDSKGLGIKPIYVVFPGDNSDEIPSGEVKEERIVIHPKSQKPGTYWRKSFNEVNILVPRIFGARRTESGSKSLNTRRWKCLTVLSGIIEALPTPTP